MAYVSTVFAALILIFVQLPFKFSAKPADSAPSVKAAPEPLSEPRDLPQSGSDAQYDGDLDTGCGTTGPLRFLDLLFSAEVGLPNVWPLRLSSKNVAEEYCLQQLILKGFQQFQDEFGNPVNRYNIRQGGFTSDLNIIHPCIPVQYNFECSDSAATLAKTCPLPSNKEPCQKWIYMWTMFKANTLTGQVLLKLTVYDLRVFGFELCDPYKPQVNITIKLESHTDLSGTSCQELCRALADFTTLVSLLCSYWVPSMIECEFPDPDQ